jgi:hypothetical protein
MVPIFISLIVQIDCDIERFADSVKGFKVVDKYLKTADNEILRLSKYFNLPQCEAHIEEPSTVVDKFGRIVTWHLPGIMWQPRIVSHFNFCIFSILPLRIRRNTILL